MRSVAKRVTIYFQPEVHRALRVKAAETDSSISNLVNDAVSRSLAEDASDLASFEERKAEPATPLETVLRNLKRDGRL